MTMIEIKYVKGDATAPIGDGNKIISHVCNDENRWGLGFVLALSKKWRQPEIAYHMMKDMTLGNVQFVRVEDTIIVANMIGQHSVGTKNGVPPVRYSAIRECLIKVNEEALLTGSSLHCPRFGAGLSGGDWNVIEQIIKETITVPVTVYDFN